MANDRPLAITPNHRISAKFVSVVALDRSSQALRARCVLRPSPLVRSTVASRAAHSRFSPSRSPSPLLTFIMSFRDVVRSCFAVSVFFPMPDDVRTLLPVDHREPVAGLRSLHMHRRWRRFTQLHHVSIPSKGEAPTPRAKLPQKKSSSAAVPRSRRALH